MNPMARNKFLLFVLLYSGIGVNSLSYDYTAVTKCLDKPEKAQYGGGTITNPEFDDGLNGWSNFGEAKLQHREFQGNSFIVAHTRNQTYDSVSQKLHLQKDHIYTFSAWIRVSAGDKVPVTASFKTASGIRDAGSVLAESHCWSFLKGGLNVDDSGPAQIFFQSKDTSVEIWVDSVSLQPFTQIQWKAHQDHNIQKVRKSRVKIKVVDPQGRAVPNATLSIQAKKPAFPFGCVMNKEILANSAYRNWFTSRGFTITTFGNEMKWYSNEPSQGQEDYSAADAMLRLAEEHGLAVRGHNVFWDDPHYQMRWVNALSSDPAQLSAAAAKRQYSVMSRYKGRVVAWDVVNENMHFGFFEDQLGKDASGVFYNRAFAADPETTMFLNEYNTIEEAGDASVSPSSYMAKVNEIRGFPGNGNGRLGIGLESHFNGATPNLAYVRSGVDFLAATGLPIWITELDVKEGPDQAKYLEQLLRELHSHPKIQGIVLWPSLASNGCSEMCLTDMNFKNLPAGDVVDKLLHEWGYKKDVVYGTADSSGFFEASLFHGDYELKVDDPRVTTYNSLSHKLRVHPKLASHKTPTMLIQLSNSN